MSYAYRAQDLETQIQRAKDELKEGWDQLEKAQKDFENYRAAELFKMLKELPQIIVHQDPK